MAEPLPELPLVAIVGRPNVGKSALFNRIAGRRISIVHDQPGVTRDRIEARCRAGDHHFRLMDTGGIGADVDHDFTAQVAMEAGIAMEAASLILFVVDGKEGLTPVDDELARLLRRAAAPILLVVNKTDEELHEMRALEFRKLGLPRVYHVSAAHGRGMSALLEGLVASLPEMPPFDPELTASLPVKIAIIGRPNVGKSSLVNAICGDQRVIVSDIAGTTRDAIDVPVRMEGHDYLMIDTAGLRTRGKRDTSVEVFSAMRTQKCIERADLCILVVDGSQGVTAQDKKISGMIIEAVKPTIIVVNKLDLVEKAQPSKGWMKEMLEDVRARLFFLPHVPVLALSALKGSHVAQLFQLIQRIRRASLTRVNTGQLNRLLTAAVEKQAPPPKGNKRFKLLYATQVRDERAGAIPVPEIVFFVNHESLLVDSYRRYLEGVIRKHRSFYGLPLRMRFRSRPPKSKN